MHGPPERCGCSWCGIDSSPDKRSAPFVDILIVWGQILLWDTSRPECPCDDQERQPLADPNGPLGGAVSEGDTRSPCGGGGRVLPSSSTAGRLLPVDVTKSASMRMGFGDRGLARRGRPVCLWVAAMQDCHVFGRRCPPLMLPGGPGRW